MSGQPPRDDPSPSASRVAQAARYIAQNRERYGMSALLQKLAEHGYSEAEIDAAYEQFQRYGGPEDVSARRFIIAALAIGAAILLISCGYCLVNFRI